MAFTNSFHSSAKSHAIGSASALAGVEAHNERDFFSLRYSAEKNHFIVGTSGLSDTVKDFINETFTPHIDTYNEKQKRKDRRITDTAFDYFCSNKKLDIAAEAIFQIADQDFWNRWRTDTVIQHRDKEIVRSEYPEHITAVMDEIYRRQIDAYERIYETHGAEILAKIETQYSRCQETLDTFRTNPELYERFEKLAEMKAKPRQKALKELSAEELEAYDTFQEAYYSARDIERRQYRERIDAGQLHIKMLQAIGHYDEKAPHAHGVSVCWADGYKSGLPSRLAKAVVLNRYALEVIQDRLHEIAQEEIAKHPEIFGQEKLLEKGVGRNMDYTTEQHIRQQNEKLQLERSRLTGAVGKLKIEKVMLQDDARELQLEHSRLTDTVDKLKTEKTELQDENDRLAQELAILQSQNAAVAVQLAARQEELEEICKIKTIAERDQVAAEAMGQIEELQSAIDVADDFAYAAEQELEYGGLNLRNLVEDFLFDWKRIRERIGELVDSIKEKIRNIGIFELLKKVLPENQIAGALRESLDNTLAGAKKTAGPAKPGVAIERDLKGL